MGGRLVLTTEEASRWYDLWSTADRRHIQEEFERLAVHRCYVPPSGGYVGCENAEGRKVMFLAPGYVWFARGCGSERVEPNWNGYTLSTFRSRSKPNPDLDADDSVACPLHWYVLPLSGRCDLCEERG